MTRSWAATLLFFGFFGLYLYSASPHVAAYRDTGEMAVLSKTLGVAHPPGYPLYTIASNAFQRISWGNPVYRANVFSGFCGALAVMVLFILLTTWVDGFSAFAAAVFYGFSTLFWELAAVSEMYTLGVLMLCLLLLFLIRWKNFALFSFAAGLALGVRMDLLLLYPVFLIWVWREKNRPPLYKLLWPFFLGLSVFLYLPIRSLRDPWLDWGNPDNIAALFNSMRRKSYSGTLDLLSLSYKTGENFFAGLRLYIDSVNDGFTWRGTAVIIAGGLAAWKKQRETSMLLFVCFALTGPVFLFLANMPPNPHAVAIIEASFLVPHLFLAMLFAFGCAWIIGLGMPRMAVALLLGVFVLLGLPDHSARGVKRHHNYDRDFVTNAWRSINKDAVAVFQKDVQLFSMWASQLVDRKRPDVALVPKGLSASPWYWEMHRRWPTRQTLDASLKDAAGWVDLKSVIVDRTLLVSQDAEILGPENFTLAPHGLLTELRSPAAPIEGNLGFLLTELCVYRGIYRYGAPADFFASDLIGDHARAFHRQGLFEMNRKNYARADWYFTHSGRLDPTFPRANMDRGYLAFIQNNFSGALALQNRAILQYERMLKQTKEFNSLPDVVAGVRADLSSAYVNAGVSCERLNDLEEARRFYEKGFRLYPNAQAYYNMGVTYWNRDWKRVSDYLREALRVDPKFSDAEKFLRAAEGHLRNG